MRDLFKLNLGFILALNISGSLLAQQPKPAEKPEKVVSNKVESISVLSCKETVTGSELNFKVVSTISSIKFENWAQYGTSSREIKIELKDDNRTFIAQGVMKGESVPKKVLSSEISSKYFLDQKTTPDSLGNAYSLEQGGSDSQGRRYPTDFLRIKASIAKEDRVALSEVVPDRKVSHLAINLVLPESRLRKDRTFTADGYAHYDLDDEGIDFTLGLAHFECRENSEK